MNVLDARTQLPFNYWCVLSGKAPTYNGAERETEEAQWGGVSSWAERKEKLHWGQGVDSLFHTVRPFAVGNRYPFKPSQKQPGQGAPCHSQWGIWTSLTRSACRRDFTHICFFLIFQPQGDWLVGSPISSSRHQPQGYCLSLEVSGTRTLRKSSSAKCRSNGLAQNFSSFCFWSWIQMISRASTKTGPCRGHGAYKLHPRFSAPSSRDREASVSGLLVEYLAGWLRWGGRRDQESRLPGLCLPSSNMPL